jgi:hypothetical protein
MTDRRRVTGQRSRVAAWRTCSSVGRLARLKCCGWVDLGRLEMGGLVGSTTTRSCFLLRLAWMELD